VKDALAIGPGSTATIGATSGNTLSFIDEIIIPTVSGNTHFGSATHTGTVRLGFTGGFIGSGSIAIDGGTVRIDTDAAADALLFASEQGIAIGTGATSATLDIGGIEVLLSELTGNAQGIITNTGAAAMLTTYNVADTTFAGVIKDGTGQLALIKRGSGALTLAGINTYTGDTTVAKGTLDVTGSIKSAGVTVESGGTLKVDGASLLDSAAVTLNGTGNMTLSGDETIGTLVSASSTSGLTLGANTLTVAPQVRPPSRAPSPAQAG
jgi:autotransporter-associated beta strand protein